MVAACPAHDIEVGVGVPHRSPGSTCLYPGSDSLLRIYSASTRYNVSLLFCRIYDFIKGRLLLLWRDDSTVVELRNRPYEYLRYKKTPQLLRCFGGWTG